MSLDYGRTCCVSAADSTNYLQELLISMLFGCVVRERQAGIGRNDANHTKPW